MFKFPTIPKNWENFLVCIIFQLCLPLLPLGMEKLLTGDVQASSLTITTAIYAITIGGSSQSLLELTFGIVVGMFFAAIFGFVISGNELAELPTRLVSWIFIMASALFHLPERYNRHVVDREQFFQFKLEEEKEKE